MNIELSTIWRSLAGMGNAFLALLPHFALALLVFALFVFLGRAARSLAARYAAHNEARDALALAFGRIAYTIVLMFGALVAATVAFPSFTPANLLATLGFGGVAIGFAFKDIFQNFLAGLLILITRPFRVGDQIVYDKYEGTVEDIETRATLVRTYDGRRVVIPNADLYTNPVTVNTAFDQRRMQYDFGIGYGDDIETARGIILNALREAEGVSPDPKADVIVVDLAASTVNLRARWWSTSTMADVLVAMDKVLTRVKHDLSAAGIDLPYPTRQILFHDQTEATDGDRRHQREGWPAGPDGNAVPPQRGIALAIEQSSPTAPRPPG